MNIFRRRFLQSVGLSTSAAALSAQPTKRKTQILAWHVAGFSCVTCAAGLETLLSRQQGVVRVQVKDPEGAVLIDYEAARISDRELRAAVAEMGFRVEPSA